MLKKRIWIHSVWVCFSGLQNIFFFFFWYFQLRNQWTVNSSGVIYQPVLCNQGPFKPSHHRPETTFEHWKCLSQQGGLGYININSRKHRVQLCYGKEWNVVPVKISLFQNVLSVRRAGSEVFPVCDTRMRLCKQGELSHWAQLMGTSSPQICALSKHLVFIHICSRFGLWRWFWLAEHTWFASLFTSH